VRKHEREVRLRVLLQALGCLLYVLQSSCPTTDHIMFTTSDRTGKANTSLTLKLILIFTSSCYFFWLLSLLACFFLTFTVLLACFYAVRSDSVLQGGLFKLFSDLQVLIPLILPNMVIVSPGLG
jgi:hypothetical protein